MTMAAPESVDGDASPQKTVTVHEIFRKVLKPEIMKGRPADSVLAAAHFITLRLWDKPVKMEEVAWLYQRPEREVRSCCSYLMQELRIIPPLPSLEPIVDRLCNHLPVGNPVRKECLLLARNRAMKAIATGKDLWIVAGALIYWASRKLKKNITQSQIACLVGCSEVALRNRWKELCEAYGPP